MADYLVINNIAIITCKNPPVNQLSFNLREGLFAGLESARKDSNVKAVVIIGGGATFPAGADVKEFATGQAFKKPINEFIDECERFIKPVVAAIHGTCLGGGLEIALGCHYRVGTSRCKLGFPEVLLGLLPGAGGTQRLPRVTGSLIAAEMIVSGQSINADRAKKIGLLDEVVEIEENQFSVTVEQLIVERAACAFAEKIASRSFQDRIISYRSCEPANDFFYDQIRKMASKGARGHLAPELCIQAVKAASESKTFEDGIKKERELFFKLASSPQSSSLQHIFFAQREISKVPGVDSSKAIRIKKVGIVGCGTMGGGIAMNFVQNGTPVVILETKQEYLDHGLNIVKGNWASQVKKGKLSKKKFEKYLSLIKPTLSFSDFRDVDIVIEAVFENMKIKKDVFAKLESSCKKDCILASNTSFLNIDEIASATSRSQKVIGTHFFAPANQMQLLENVRGSKSDEITIATVQQMAKDIKKKGVLVGNCEGFVGNRMFAVYGAEGFALLEEGCLPEQIDKALYDYGWAMGIFQVSDLSGNDISYRHRDEKGWVKDPSKRPKGRYTFTIPDRLVEQNRLGLKTSKGFYNYESGKRIPIPSPEVKKIVEQVCQEKSITRRKISDQEIIERCMYPMVNEGFKILEEGIALRPSDIDVVFVFGYGYPAHRGGIMFWGDTVGLKTIYESLSKYYQKYPDATYFKPSSLLEKLAKEGITLDKYWKKQNKPSKL